jgi:GT2 family glycosyltransferase
LVTWNSADKLPDPLTALASQRYPRFELIAVDNASCDRSLEQVHARFPGAKSVRNPDNRGFSGGHNQAIRLAAGEYYLPLNPDVVVTPDYIGHLVEALETHPECGSAAGKLLREPGVIDSSGLFINRRRQQFLRGHGEADRGQYEMPGEVFGVDGAAPLYRRSMLEDVREADDYFDQDFFAYKEDVDLAWRARWLGWSTWYEPRAVALHGRRFQPGNRSVSPQIRFYSVRNRYFLLMKNESREGWRRDALPIFFYDLQIAMYLLLRERRSLGAAPAAWSLRRRMGRKHAALMARRRASPAAMLEWFR